MQAKTETGEGKERKERAGVQSLERAFSILTHIAQSEEGITLAELSRLVRLHTSTTFHLVRTMVELEAVRQDAATKRYHLGRRVFGLAASASHEIELVAAGRPHLEELAERTGETTHLGLVCANEVIVAARVAGAGAFQLTERSGGVRPAHSTSLGKVLLAALPPAKFETFLKTVPLLASSPNTITDPTLLRAEVERVRQTGIAFDDAEFNAEVRCIAAPVRDYTGEVVAALGVSGPIWRMTLQRMNDLEVLVRATAEQLSRDLGFRVAAE